MTPDEIIALKAVGVTADQILEAQMLVAADRAAKQRTAAALRQQRYRVTHRERYSVTPQERYSAPNDLKNNKTVTVSRRDSVTHGNGLKNNETVTPVTRDSVTHAPRNGLQNNENVTPVTRDSVTRRATQKEKFPHTPSKEKASPRKEPELFYSPENNLLTSEPHARVANGVPTANGHGNRLPDDWEPSAKDVEVAASHGIVGERLRIEALKFRNYWSAKSGKDATKRSWPRTFENWCIKAAEDGVKGNGSVPRAPPFDSRTPHERYRDDIDRVYNEINEVAERWEGKS